MHGRFPSLSNSDNRLAAFSVKNNGIEKAGQRTMGRELGGVGVDPESDRVFVGIVFDGTGG